MRLVSWRFGRRRVFWKAPRTDLCFIVGTLRSPSSTGNDRVLSHRTKRTNRYCLWGLQATSSSRCSNSPTAGRTRPPLQRPAWRCARRNSAALSESTTLTRTSAHAGSITSASRFDLESVLASLFLGEKTPNDTLQREWVSNPPVSKKVSFFSKSDKKKTKGRKKPQADRGGGERGLHVASAARDRFGQRLRRAQVALGGAAARA